MKNSILKNSLLFIGLAALAFAACAPNPLTPPEPEPPYGWRTVEKYRTMVPAVRSGTTVTVSGAGLIGVFVADRAVILDTYSIAAYETTWELWKEVYDWAVVNGYTFANPGTEGHGTSGTGSASWGSAARTSRPVTGISWRDAVVWCNACSELSGLEPVYYTEDGKPLRASDTGEAEEVGEAVPVTARRDRNGFRLPLETEWEYAARGGDTEAADWNNYAYAGGNTPESLAWHAVNAGIEGGAAYGAHSVGGKTANRLGLYDMSGNAAEWCWDRHNNDPVTQETPPDGAASGQERVIRGGSWRGNAAACGVKARSHGLTPADDLGFRVVRSVKSDGETVNSGSFLPTLEGTHWYWNSPWGLREIDFGAEGRAVFTDPAEPPPVYHVSYTYDPSLGRGNISGSYPAGDFQLRGKNKVMFFPQFRHFGHSVQFEFQEEEE